MKQALSEFWKIGTGLFGPLVFLTSIAGIAVTAKFVESGAVHLWDFLPKLVPHAWCFAVGLAFFPPLTAISIVTFVVIYWLAPNDDPEDDGSEPATVVGRCLLYSGSGLVEELSIRGVVQSLFGFWYASVGFALLHYSNRHAWQDVARTFVQGACIGCIYAYTGNVWVGVTAHVFVNVWDTLPFARRYSNFQGERLFNWLNATFGRRRTWVANSDDK
jgi:membrane protease YdiL (CAAX protease family)